MARTCHSICQCNPLYRLPRIWSDSGNITLCQSMSFVMLYWWGNSFERSQWKCSDALTFCLLYGCLIETSYLFEIIFDILYNVKRFGDFKTRCGLHCVAPFSRNPYFVFRHLKKKTTKILLKLHKGFWKCGIVSYIVFNHVCNTNEKSLKRRF